MKKPALSSPPPQVLKRTFDAPRDLVFTAWTDAAQIAQWWGPRGFTAPVCKWKAKAGNKLHVDMRGPDGTLYPMAGVFDEVARPEKIVFTCGPLDDKGKLLFEVRTTVTFAEKSGKTELTLRAEVFNATPAGAPHIAGMKEGWSQSLDRLGGLVEKSSAQGRAIVLSRVFDAPRELVWNAMTDPGHVVHWWGPRGFSTKIEKMDFRPGGVWKHVMRGPDGVEYPNKSVFREIVKPEKIVYTHGGGRKGAVGVSFTSTWTFEIEGPKTKVTIHMLFPSVEERDRVVKEYGALEGGKQTLERLGEYLAKVMA